MNILHFTLGLAPHRSGGLTKYATDLLLAQQNSGHKVSLLYAGGLNLKYPLKRIRKKVTRFDVIAYRLSNSVVIPLLYGVKNPLSLLGKSSMLTKKELENFYAQVKPDIFHIHTLMGLPYELVEYLKLKGTKIIFSTHDYYGLCLKVNFINEKGKVCSNPSGKNCAVCNYNAPSNFFLRIRNSSILLNLKNKLPQAKLTKISKTTSNITGYVNPNISSSTEQEYELLMLYYKNIFAAFDGFHFNSEITKQMYSNYMDVPKSEVISITHNGIKDNRVIKSFDKEKIRLTFIGSTDIYKGLPELKRILTSLDKQGALNWTLNIWGGELSNDEDYPNINYRGKYNSNQLKEVFRETDLLIVPSLCKETFSLITLEALSFGVPVLVSSNVGAKDIVCRYDSKFVYETGDNLREILYSVLQDVSILEKYNEKIVEYSWNHSLSSHVGKINNLYKKILNENSIH